ncbi:hypothetical protein [Cellulosimicrobium sp. Marseille-Q4280]|uniref:hypothetical protein n=1 Tax=Cellulosimicrobium sp. Marseille-Q4280 TaxID=2937992 RepID=UPI00203C7C02|nr:hypothetical protein [Cellulosimicrobium sp. Marseille-Q4280]
MTAPELPDPRTARLIRHVKHAVFVPTILTMYAASCMALLTLGFGTVDDALVSAGVRAEHALDPNGFLESWTSIVLVLWVRLVLLGVCIAAVAWVLPVSARDIALAEQSLRDEHRQALRSAAADAALAERLLRDERHAAARRRDAISASRARSVARSTLRPSSADRRGPRYDVPPVPRVAGARR